MTLHKRKKTWPQEQPDLECSLYTTGFQIWGTYFSSSDFHVPLSDNNHYGSLQSLFILRRTLEISSRVSQRIKEKWHHQCKDFWPAGSMQLREPGCRRALQPRLHILREWIILRKCHSAVFHPYLGSNSTCFIHLGYLVANMELWPMELFIRQ